jgi:TonB family protein
MRNLLTASLLLSPVLFTASAVAIQPKGEVKNDAPAATQPRRISTGLIAPHILDADKIRVWSSDVSRVATPEGQVELSVNLDEKGNPTQVQVVKSLTPEADAHIVEQVRQAHFRPATLDNQAIPYTMGLVVVIRR